MKKKKSLRRSIRNTMKQRVLRGAKLLDKARPEWFKKVDPRVLGMDDGRSCVLGQTYSAEGYYSQGLEILGLDDDDLAGTRHAERFGFMLTDKECAIGHAARNWSVLTELWIDQVAKRVKRERREFIQASYE